MTITEYGYTSTRRDISKTGLEQCLDSSAESLK
jgi:hypothetical protein